MSESSPHVPASDTPTSSNPSKTPQAQETKSPSKRVSGPHPHSTLSQRSCVTCRRRKVRCDKVHPTCGNCTKAHIECIFPGPGRAPRKTKKPADTDLLSRLRRLEGVVLSLGAQVDEDGSVTQNGIVQSPKAMSSIVGQLQVRSGRDSPGSEGSGEGFGHRGSIDKQVGRLVINEGRSRYVSNAFWASMGDEIAEMRDILDNPSDEDDEELDSPEASASGVPSPNHQGFIFGYSSSMVKMRSLHPSPSQIFILWEVFKENVDPLVRVLHRPTAKNILINASSNTDSLSKSAEALLFAIYFGAVVSLTPEQCQTLLGENKENLLKRYRFATEQALARAGFLNSSSLMLLQAFVFFLICVRHVDDTRMVWSLSGLAIHLAQALGIHRDGTNFNLNPFETEMRRRLWWHISILDTRSSEDHGTDPTFSEQFYDTRLPMNINDDDIYPEMKEIPKERVGCTEMTFCLLRFELSCASRRLNFSPPGSDAWGSPEGAKKIIEEKEKVIDACHKMVEEKYLQYCDMNIPIYWVTATVGRLILAKLWLMAHHPLAMRNDGVDAPSPEIKERLFITSVELIEYSYLLEKDENTAKWGWLFRTYMQWHAVAFVLSELCIRPPGPCYDRAWRAVESVYDERVIEHPRMQKGMLWKPLKLLHARATAVREQRPKTWNNRPVDTPKFPAPFNPGVGSNDGSMASLRYPGGVIHSTADALGLELDDNLLTGADVNYNEPIQLSSAGGIPLQIFDGEGDTNISQQQTGMTDQQISQWLATEDTSQMQSNLDFLNWSGWSLGPDPITQFPIVESQKQQEWY